MRVVSGLPSYRSYSVTLLVIFGPRGSFWFSSAWTRANPSAKTRKTDRKIFLNFMVVNISAALWMWKNGRRKASLHLGVEDEWGYVISVSDTAVFLGLDQYYT